MKPTIDRIHTEVAGALGESPGDVPVDANLVDYGLDSVRLMALVESWRTEFGATRTFLDFAEKPVIEEWARLLGAEG